jgi:hypothetical protein
VNLVQLDRALLYRLDALRQSGTVISGNWPQEERYHALNLGNREVARRIRMQQQDHFTIRRRSTEAATFILDRTYDPASFGIVSGTASYTLPPDFLEMRAIVALTTGREHIAFHLTTENDPEVHSLKRVVDTSTQPSRYVAVVGAERTVTYFPTPRESLALEIAYVRQVPRLVQFSQGTVTTATSGGVTTVTNALSGLNWSPTVGAAGVYPGDEIAFNNASTDGTNGELTDYWYPIATIATTQLTLARDLRSQWGDSLTLSTPTNYIIASVPQYHPDWHQAVVAFAVYELLGKATEVEVAQLAEGARREWDRWSTMLVPESARRQTQEHEVATDGWLVYGDGSLG